MCFRNTGIKRDEFLKISENLETIRNTFQRTKNQALAVYLFWLKTGLDQTTIAVHFDIEFQYEVCRYLDQVREAFMVQLAKENLGANHLSRKQWIE